MTIKTGTSPDWNTGRARLSSPRAVTTTLIRLSPTRSGIEAEALTAEFLRCRRQLQAVIFRVVRSWDEAQALTQDCFLRAFRARHTFNGQASPATWLTRIAINLSYEWLRRVRHESFSAEQPAIAAELRAARIARPEDSSYFARRDLASSARGSLSPAGRSARYAL